MGVKIALAGNPNSGKTTLFNALTGSNQFVGNWPGVTVEKKKENGKEDKEVVIMGPSRYLFFITIYIGGSCSQKLSDHRASGCNPEYRRRNKPGA